MQVVIRAFGGDLVTQVEGNTVNPLRDMDTVIAELLR
jgi:ribosome-binding ATPase YchF (GTP1/OBG family)